MTLELFINNPINRNLLQNQIDGGIMLKIIGLEELNSIKENIIEIIGDESENSRI